MRKVFLISMVRRFLKDLKIVSESLNVFISFLKVLCVDMIRFMKECFI